MQHNAIALRHAILESYRTAVGSTGYARTKDGATTVAEFDLNATPFTAPSAGAMTLTGQPIAATVTNNTVDDVTPLTCEFYNGADELQFTLTVSVAAGAGEVKITAPADTNGNPALVVGQSVPLSLTMTAPS